MASICIIADTHRKHRELTIPECDILIHCGDFCSFEQEDEKTLHDVDAWFAEAPARYVVCVGGNHDFLLQSGEFRFGHATFLEDSLVEIAGLSIYGSPWCPDLSGFAYYATEEQLIERWRKIPSGVDILITHTPPYGFLDVPTAGDIHLGCSHLHDELRRIQPRLHVFGHVHASHGAHTEGGTRFVNAAIVGGRNYEVRHAPTMVTLTPTSGQGGVGPPATHSEPKSYGEDKHRMCAPGSGYQASSVSQEMGDSTTKRKRKWWNNGWIGLAALLGIYVVLFITGKNSLQSEANPLVEGRLLSEWADELRNHDSSYARNGPDEVLRRHQQEVLPVLVGWLDKRDTFPQLVYFFTISRYRGDPIYYIRDDLGAHSWQLRAAKASLELRRNDPFLVAALERNLEHYRVQNDFKKGRNELAEIVESALRNQKQ